MPRPARVKDLQARIAELEAELVKSTEEKEKVNQELVEAQTTIAEKDELIVAARAAAEATEANAEHLEVPVDDGTIIYRPVMPGNKRVHLRKAMQLGNKKYKDQYAAIVKGVRYLAIQTDLDWKLDFRLHKAEDLALLYRAARTKFPYLKRFHNDWATAELVKRFMQNARSYARKKGYMDYAGRPRRTGGGQPRGAGDEDEDGEDEESGREES